MVRKFARYLFTQDRLIVVLFAILLIAYGRETFSLQKTIMEDVVGPATFPQLLVVFGLILVAIFFAQQKFSSPGIEEETGRKAVGEVIDLIPIAIALVYAALFEELGFLIATLLYITVTMRFLGEPWMRAVAYGLGLTLLVFVVFFYGLQAQLPLGETTPVGKWFPFIEKARDWLVG